MVKSVCFLNFLFFILVFPDTITDIGPSQSSAPSRVSIQLDANNLPVIAYQGSSGFNRTLQLAFCSDLVCVNQTHVVVDNSTQNTGDYLAFGMNSQHFPIKIGRAVQQECRDRSRMPSSA
eukprot:TRINITY_DN54552_c0_g1_i3.p1 TRINITY_DN54552_c0_g1~~TRINITY_DN54552_c0_g1_i3.p1  ORF type:complete len:120 (+),score=7.94 TRINITY_DN54552_c0_g1_i3:80-439(+)